jgi:peptide/nickel transport system substrate-binding protein
MKDLKSIFLAEQEQKFKAGRINRRTFVSSMVAAGVALPSALGMASQAWAATPKKGGHYRLGLGHGSTTDSLDPATYENGFMSNLSTSMFNCLTEIAPDGSLRGDLAESWEAANGGASWIFNLRAGVEFHNGKTLTADDVIASLNYHRGEDSKSAAKGLLSSVTDIRADGPNRVVIDLTESNADFPFVIGDYHLVILPGMDGKIDPVGGVGTGAYALNNFEPGVRAELSRNGNFFRETYFDEVTILSIIDITARQNALLSGQVDVIDRLDPKTVGLLSRSPAVNILESTGYLHYTFPMRLDTAPFDNYDLRMALKYAIKRQEMVDKILLGHGAVGNDHPISPAVPYHAAGLEQREFDAEKAAFHYKKSGHSGAIQLSASDAAFAGAVDAAQLIQASAAEAGINIEVVREPSDGYWSNVWNKKGWSACYWGGRPTQDWMYTAAYTNDTEWNDTAWKDTDAANKFNSIVVAARSELDDVKRAAMYAECQALINDDGGAIVPMFANYIMGLSSKIGHADDVAANWSLDGSHSAERWWFN